MHVTLRLEQEHAGYYGVKSTLDGNPSDSGRLTAVVLEAVSRRKSFR